MSRTCRCSVTWSWKLLWSLLRSLRSIPEDCAAYSARHSHTCCSSSVGETSREALAGHSRSQCSAAAALQTQLSGTTLALLISGFRSSNWSGNETCELHSFNCKGSDAPEQPPAIADNADRIKCMEGKSALCDKLRCVRYTHVVIPEAVYSCCATDTKRYRHSTFHSNEPSARSLKIVTPHAMVY